MGTESEVTLFTQGSYLVTCSVGTPHYNSALEPRSWAAVLCFSISTKHTGHKWLFFPHPILCFMTQAVREVLLHDGPPLVSAASQWSVLPGVSRVLTNIEGCWCCWGGRCMSWQPRVPPGDSTYLDDWCLGSGMSLRTSRRDTCTDGSKRPRSVPKRMLTKSASPQGQCESLRNDGPEEKSL